MHATGVSMVCGGIKYKNQTFNRLSAGVSSVLLIISIVGANELSSIVKGNQKKKGKEKLDYEFIILCWILMLSRCIHPHTVLPNVSLSLSLLYGSTRNQSRAATVTSKWTAGSAIRFPSTPACTPERS
jgi:Ca2+/H+ antiporter